MNSYYFSLEWLIIGSMALVSIAFAILDNKSWIERIINFTGLIIMSMIIIYICEIRGLNNCNKTVVVLVTYFPMVITLAIKGELSNRKVHLKRLENKMRKKNIKTEDNPTLYCLECGKEMECVLVDEKLIYRCLGYPDCNYAESEDGKRRVCPRCGSRLIKKKISNINFYECSNMGICGFTERVQK